MRLAFVMLVISVVLVAQKPAAKGTKVEAAHNDSIQEISEAIYARLVAQWEGWKNQDPAPNDSIIADDYQSVVFDGSRHAGKPPAKQMSEQPISGYKISEFRIVPVGADAALVTYFAEIKSPARDAEFRMSVGESWAKQNGQWRIRAFSGTLMK
jgi:hypothetical protein